MAEVNYNCKTLSKAPTLRVFDELLARLTVDFPQLQFSAGKSFCWSPISGQVFYTAIHAGSKSGSLNYSEDATALFSLLHETGHALLGHKRYELDLELLNLEVAAWQRAKALAGQYDIGIDENHIEDCLDSYRDWLYARSVCPSCTTKALQMDSMSAYRCFNCATTWKVTASRFCRPYRKRKEAGLSGASSSAVFAAIRST